MRDRQSTQPGRVLITPEDGSAAFYATMEMADEPTELGTPPTKENLLTDETEVALFGAATDRTVNQAFAGIAGKISLIMSDMASMTLTVKSVAGNPVSGVLVAGIFDDSGNPMYTDESGVISGYVSEGSVVLSISGYADVADYSETIDVTKGASYTKEISVTVKNFLKLTSSKSIKFSGNVSQVDVTVVGGGGGGGGGYARESCGGGGGGGGNCTVQENVSFEPNTSYSASVGSGGSAGAVSGGNGGAGGTSSFLGVSAGGGSGGNGGSSSGASGGAGNGAGGRGAKRSSSITATAGAQGSVLGFSSFTETVRYGGGGGGGTGGSSSTYYGASGGADYGADYNNAAANGTGGGGGGGTGYSYDSYTNGEYDGTEYVQSVGGKGGSGCVAIRMHLTAA